MRPPDRTGDDVVHEVNVSFESRYILGSRRGWTQSEWEIKHRDQTSTRHHHHLTLRAVVVRITAEDEWEER